MPTGPARRLAAALPLVLALAGCAETGDFGRQKPGFLQDTVVPAMGRSAAYARDEPVAWGLLTDDEQELRRRAWHFVMPPQARNGLERQAAAAALARITPGDPAAGDPARTFEAIVAMPDISPRARYQRLRELIEADRLLMGPFVALSCRVIDMDKVRIRALEAIADPGPWTRDQATARVAENDALIAWVQSTLDTRIVEYRFALERLVVATPDRDAVRSERQLTALEIDRAGLMRCSGRGAIAVAPLGPAVRYTPRAEKPPLPPK
ncbi:MAG: hypothetical protein ACOYOJ_00970 [Alsobacter sp.]